MDVADFQFQGNNTRHPESPRGEIRGLARSNFTSEVTPRFPPTRCVLPPLSLQCLTGELIHLKKLIRAGFHGRRAIMAPG
ncbi:hypothetical protein SAY86_029361 [Trapa natans]|uniref:Uncharacterized protein n=1 Tax=Trapa natans TaxID=22666 RepID=A0AAN7MGT9_TRANT|nr:hypothetical protein SAY86_029361 [Trapa natans]